MKAISIFFTKQVLCKNGDKTLDPSQTARQCGADSDRQSQANTSSWLPSSPVVLPTANSPAAAAVGML